MLALAQSHRVPAMPHNHGQDGEKGSLVAGARRRVTAHDLPRPSNEVPWSRGPELP